MVPAAPRRERRLCTVVHGAYPPDVRIARQARAAITGGWHVDVIATRQPGQLAREVIEDAVVHRLPISHERGSGILASLWEYSAFTLLATARVAWLHAQLPYDVVQINNPPDFLLMAGVVPQMRGAMLVFDVHDRSPDMFNLRFGDTGRRARVIDSILHRLERICLRAADEVVTVHEPYRDLLIACGADASKLTVVMNSIDDVVLASVPRVLSDSDRFRVVYHGTVTPHYGVQLLVEAAAAIVDRVPTLALEIYGAGDAIYEAREAASRLGIAERTIINGQYLPHDEVLQRIYGASVGVNPNLATRHDRSAIATKLFEYVALGIPVVSADLPAVRHHFGDDQITYFTPGDVDSLANAILSIAKCPTQACRRAESAAKRYEEYRWPIQAARYLEVLNRAAGN